MNFFPRLFIVIVAFAFSQPSLAGIEYVVKETQGRGVSLSEAINSALLEAIGQVNGKQLKGESAMQTVEVSEVDGEESSYYSSEAFAKKIEESTQGTVKDYHLVKKNQTDVGWAVTVQARIAKYKQSASASRKRIAIMPVRLMASSYSLSGGSVAAENVSVSVNQALADYLTQTRKFAVLDREYMQETLGEKDLIRSDQTPAEDSARLGQQLSADYVLVGTLRALAYSEIEKASRVSDKTFTTGFGRAELGFRLINVATQQVAVSDTATVKITDAPLSSSQALSKLSQAIGKKVSQRIHSQIYPVLVVEVSNGSLILGQGGDALLVGEKYKLYKYGKKTHDPYTGEYLGRAEDYVGVVKIDRVTPKQAYASVVEANEKVSENFAVRKYILREKVGVASNAAGKNLKEFRKNKREELDNDDDW